MSKLLIVGAGGHGKVVKEVAEALETYETIAFVDDSSQESIGGIADLEALHQTYDSAFVGIGNNAFRKEIIEKLVQIGYTIPTLVHPTAYISKSCDIAYGTVVEPKAIVNANTKIGVGCIISVGAIIDHDVEIQDYVHANAGSIVKAGGKVEALRKLEAGEVVLGYASAVVKKS